jgi:MoxR-like ATPase
MPALEDFGLQPIADLAGLVAARASVAAVRLSDEVVDYVVDLVRATRGRPTLTCGASPRSANMLAAASRALAVLRGRDFVTPDDVKALAVATLRHRVVLAPGAEIEGLSADAVVRQVLEQVPAPR